MQNLRSIRRAETDDPVATLLAITKAFRALYGLKLAPAGLHNGQDELLLVLDHAGKTCSSVAAELGIRPSTVSKMTARLVERGLIERTIDHKDGRKTLLRITANGAEKRRAAAEARIDLNSELLRPTEDLQAGFKALEEIAAYLTKRLKRLR